MIKNKERAERERNASHLKKRKARANGGEFECYGHKHAENDHRAANDVHDRFQQ